MLSDALIDYIKKELEREVDREIIVAHLKSGGYSEADINAAFSEVGKINRKELVVRVTKSRIVSNVLSTIFLLIAVFLLIAYILGGEV